MKAKAAAVTEINGDAERHTNTIREGLKELSAIHRANKSMDAEIRKLQSSMRKKLDRIWENLRHVQAAG